MAATPIPLVLLAFACAPSGLRATPGGDVPGVPARSGSAVPPLSVRAAALAVPSPQVPTPTGEVNVTSFGAKGDGLTDDTIAIQAAIAAVAAAGNAQTLYFPGGTYLIGDTLRFTPVPDVITGQLRGQRWRGDGAAATFLKAKAGFSASHLIFIGNPDYASTGRYSLNNVLEDLSVLPEEMPDTTAHAGVFMYGTYNNALRNLQVSRLQYPFHRWDLCLGRGVYTTTLTGVHGQQLQIASDTNDRVTTVTVTGGSWTFINISNALGITFNGVTVQGTTEVGYQPNRIQIADSYSVTFIGGDFEGTGTLFAITRSQWITSLNNNLMGWGGGAYLEEGGGNVRLAMLDNLTFRDRGTFTPTIAGHEGGVAAFTVRRGRYQRVGNRVHFGISLEWSGWSAPPSGVYVVTGLPFTSNEESDAAVAVARVNLQGAVGQILARIPPNGSQINLESFVAGGTGPVFATNAPGTLYLAGTYEVADELLPRGAPGFGWAALRGMP